MFVICVDVECFISSILNSLFCILTKSGCLPKIQPADDIREIGPTLEFDPYCKRRIWFSPGIQKIYKKGTHENVLRQKKRLLSSTRATHWVHLCHFLLIERRFWWWQRWRRCWTRVPTLCWTLRWNSWILESFGMRRRFMWSSRPSFSSAGEIPEEKYRLATRDRFNRQCQSNQNPVF